MRVPLVYSAAEIKQWSCDEEFEPGRWRPARPCGFECVWPRHFVMRLRITWRVFTGKLDALNWDGKTDQCK